MLIGLPALRLSGLYLALITLMAAGAVNVVLTTINFPNGGHGFTGHTSTPDLAGLQAVGRPGIAEWRHGLLPLHDHRLRLLFLLIAVHFATKPGRAWASIRESEPAALAAGVNIVTLQALGVRARVVHDRASPAPCSPRSSASRPPSASRRRTR